MQPMQPIQLHATGHPADAGGSGFFGVLGSACWGLGAKFISGTHSAIRKPGYEALKYAMATCTYGTSDKSNLLHDTVALGGTRQLVGMIE